MIREATAGWLAEPSITSPVGSTSSESARGGASTGVKVGAGLGVALGISAAPVMGVAHTALIAAGAAMRGSEVEGVIGAMSDGHRARYPSPVILRVTSEPTCDIPH